MSQLVNKDVLDLLGNASQPSVRFFEERIRYLAHLIESGWAKITVKRIAATLAGFGAGLEIRCECGLTRAQIGAAADAWIKQSRHRFRRDDGAELKRKLVTHDTARWLRFLGCLRESEPLTGPYAEWLTEFCAYMGRERGFAPTTIRVRRGHILRFLNWFSQQSRPFREVSIEDVERFLGLPRQPSWKRSTTSVYVDALRCFFSYAKTRDWCLASIGDAIDAPRLYSMSGLPAGPTWSQVKQLIASIGVRTPADIRNRALIMLMSVYGFRSQEVRHLKLDDLDWEREVIFLRRLKSHSEHQFPLVHDVGAAILLYLQKARPLTRRREVFLRLRAPFEPMTDGGMSAMVSCHLKGLGIKLPHYGPHALRHACATHLLAEGFSLKEIGNQLGHTDPRSTMIYAKVDLKGLRQVANLRLGDLL